MSTSGIHPGTRIHFGAYPVVFLLVAVPGLVQAQDSVYENWACQRCLSAAGWEFDIDGGPAYVTDDAFRFGDYTGLDEQGFSLFGDIFARYWGEDASYLLFEGYTRGQDSSALFFRGGKQSVYEVRASYQSIPRRVFDTTVTPYRGTGTGQLTLPPNWVRAPTTQQMTALASLTSIPYTSSFAQRQARTRHPT